MKCWRNPSIVCTVISDGVLGNQSDALWREYFCAECARWPNGSVPHNSKECYDDGHWGSLGCRRCASYLWCLIRNFKHEGYQE